MARIVTDWGASVMSDQQITGGNLYVPAMAGFYERFSGLAYPLTRFATGLILAPHGAQKLFGLFGGGGLKGTAGFFAKVGVEPALPMAYLVGSVEFFGGLLVAIGLWTRPAAFAIAILMFGAILTVNLNNGFFWTKGGYEFPLLWGIIALTICIRGAGAMSVDAKIGREF